MAEREYDANVDLHDSYYAAVDALRQELHEAGLPTTPPLVHVPATLTDAETSLQHIVVAEAAEKHWKAAKDAAKLFKAIKVKLTLQAGALGKVMSVTWQNHPAPRKSAKLRLVPKQWELPGVTAQPITVSLLGEPVAFARMRIAARTGAHFVPAPQRNAMAALRIEAANTMLHMGAAVLDEPVAVELLAELPIPASWSKKRRNLAILGLIRPGTRPDLDNLFKLAADAMLNGVVVRNDTLVVEIHARKIYGLQPKLVVTIRPVTVAAWALPLAPAEAAA